jgi:hypothetical protein
VFLLEKRLPPEEAKNFYILGLGLRGDHGHREQKFFGSFFQKRTACWPCRTIRFDCLIGDTIAPRRRRDEQRYALCREFFPRKFGLLLS